MNSEQTFEAYCDSSGLFAERFQSIGIISGERDTLKELRKELKVILSDEQISEIKFSNVKRDDSREHNAAKGFYIKAIVGFGATNRVRADILTWDTTDSRHATPGRDDIENLGRMYYHLLRHIARQACPPYLNIIIDENENVDFTTLKDCLNSRISQSDKKELPLIIESTEQLHELETIKSISEVKSHEEPLVQLADLFAGIARFSNEKGDKCCNWLKNYGSPDQYPLPDFHVDGDGLDEYAKSDECRFHLIGELCKVCKKHRLGVSLHKRKRLCTLDPAKPINFWIYEPQGDYDKAPKG